MTPVVEVNEEEVSNKSFLIFSNFSFASNRTTRPVQGQVDQNYQ
jgi:hypothetical protein